MTKLRIVKIKKNRKRVSKKKRARNKKRAKIIRAERRAGYKAKQAEAIAYRKVPERKKRKAKRRRIIRLPNKTILSPPHIIVGFLRNANGKRLYFTGDRFSHSKKEAKFFPLNEARKEAKRILPMLPERIYGIKVEKA